MELGKPIRANINFMRNSIGNKMRPLTSELIRLFLYVNVRRPVRDLTNITINDIR
jgi:hypothetical protein